MSRREREADMRAALLILSLALPTLGFWAAPALAGAGSTGQHATAPSVVPSFVATNGLASLEQHPAASGPATPGRQSGTGTVPGPFYAGIPQSAPPRAAIVRNRPAPVAASDGTLSIETTPGGIQVVRGPGSRHFPR
jgi:hypothetical protein